MAQTHKIFSTDERNTAQLISQIANCNPFLPQRINLERQLLGPHFNNNKADWNTGTTRDDEHPNIKELANRVNLLLHGLFDRMRQVNIEKSLLTEAETDSATDLKLLEDAILLDLYHRNRPNLDRLIAGDQSLMPGQIFADLQKQLDQHLHNTGLEKLWDRQLPHFFAGFIQLRRAFKNIYGFIIGASQSAVRLRASVWRSIFTNDMHRYRKSFYQMMTDFSTLVTGPSGTGKELVARAIGLSRYIPYNARTGQFTDTSDTSFYPIHLSAMSPTLIESELFGHARGAFTGAVQQREGWFEICPTTGVVFLDEIGELEMPIQVKLLRVLQQREFSRLGETVIRRFSGKIVAATHQPLARLMQQRMFREDLYYRLCSDVVDVPSLKARLDDDPCELSLLIQTLTMRMFNADADLSDEIETKIRECVGPAYHWPGNIRELEQCIRNVVIRGEYSPAGILNEKADDQIEKLADQIRNSAISAEELVTAYCKFDYQKTKNYEETGRRLELDRRTVKSKIHPLK